MISRSGFATLKCRLDTSTNHIAHITSLCPRV